MPSQRIELPINGPTYKARGRGANIQDCINWYPEHDPTSSATGPKVVLYPTPGSRFIKDVGSNPIRALVSDTAESDERMWAVSGTTLYTITPVAATDIGYIQEDYFVANFFTPDAASEIIEDVTVTSIGTMTGFPTNTPVMILVNKDWVFILAAGEGTAWTYNKNTSTLAEVTDVDYPYKQTPSIAINTCAYHDQYFIVTAQNKETFYISDLNDPTSWNALSFASAEQFSDALVRAVSFKKELWLLGKTTTEVWQNTGAVPVAFEPLLNVFFDIGCLAPLSAAKIDDSLLFLGRDATGWGKVYVFNGFQYEVASNEAIESLINSRISQFNLDTNVANFEDNIVAYTYKDLGHSFYVLTIPASLTRGSEKGLTLVYDIHNKAWHQRASTFTDSSEGEITERHFSGETFAMSRYKHYAGHYINNKLYKLDPKEYVDFAVRDSDGIITSSTAIDRQRTSSYISDMKARTFWHFVEVDVQQGESNDTGLVANPELTLTFSNDDGQTFTSGITRKIGEEGSTRRLKFNRLGSSRDRVYRITTSSPAEIVLLNSYAEITPGDH